jgi:F420-dependent oxidoreductase-like protein
MKIGLQIPNYTWPGGPELGPGLAAVARTADEVGFDSIWVMDHFFQIGVIGKVDEPMLESYSTLGYLAGITSRVRLGTLVTGAPYRHPGVLVKQVTALDVLSGGRANLGIGAAWNEREARGLGIPFPSLKERFERLEETLQIAHQLFSGDRTPFHGRHFHLQEPINSPPPVSKPRPPILIGGSGEQKTLRLVARYADACNLFGRMGTDLLRHKLDILEGYCEEAGRPFAEIDKTALFQWDVGKNGRNVSTIVRELEELASLGFQTAIGSVKGVEDLEPLRVIGRDVIPAVR